MIDYIPFIKGEIETYPKINKQRNRSQLMNCKVLNSYYHYSKILNLQNNDHNHNQLNSPPPQRIITLPNQDIKASSRSQELLKYHFVKQSLEKTTQRQPQIKTYRLKKNISQESSIHHVTEMIDIGKYQLSLHSVEQALIRSKFDNGKLETSKIKTLPSQKVIKLRKQSTQLSSLINEKISQEQSFLQTNSPLPTINNQIQEISQIINITNDNNESQFTEILEERLPSEMKLSRRQITKQRSRSKHSSSQGQLEVQKAQEIIHQKISVYQESEERTKQRKQRIKQLESKIQEIKDYKGEFVYQAQEDKSEEQYLKQKNTPQPTARLSDTPNQKALYLKANKDLSNVSHISFLIDEEESHLQVQKTVEEIRQQKSEEHDNSIIQQKSIDNKQQEQQPKQNQPKKKEIKKKDNQQLTKEQQSQQISEVQQQPKLEPTVNQKQQQQKQQQQEQEQIQLQTKAQDSPQIKTNSQKADLKKLENQIAQLQDSMNQQEIEQKKQIEEINFVDFMLSQANIFDTNYEQFKLSKRKITIPDPPLYFQDVEKEVFNELKNWEIVNKLNLKILIKQKKLNSRSNLSSLTDLKSQKIIQEDDSDDSID